jgi:hypothetical protein
MAAQEELAKLKRESARIRNANQGRRALLGLGCVDI